jgi:hypothetical protein
MTAAARRARKMISAGLLALAGACQPLPHPFEDDRPPAAMLAVPDASNVAVGTLDGEPSAAATGLAAAITKELIKRDIPASQQTVSRVSYLLDGRIETQPTPDGKTVLIVFWRLRDAAGNIVLERHDHLVAPGHDWDNADSDSIAHLAALSADKLVLRLTDQTPREQPAGGGAPSGGRVRVAIRKVEGAPGDGNESLTTSLAAVLKHADVDLVASPADKPDLVVDAEITTEPLKPDKQHIKIVWHMSRLTGGEIGTVAQENDVPRGRLDGPWGDVAYSIAIAAGPGIMQLVDRGAPPIRVGSTTPQVAPSEPSPASAPTATEPLPATAGATSPANAAPTPPEMPAPLPPPDVPVLLPYRGVPRLPQ